ncbi:MAG: hypothetical protein KDK37_19465, partial [Leptospiraceae bacterium]|nr:hypothetical protein [Leptospiraceae bacterium]
MLLNFLEVFAANSSTNSGETSSSLINSVRNNTSIYSSQIVKYTEVSANRQNTVSPGFRYNRRFEGSDFFIGVSYAETTNLTFLRQIYGNDNSYFRDRTNARER